MTGFDYAKWWDGHSIISQGDGACSDGVASPCFLSPFEGSKGNSKLEPVP